MKFYLGTHHPNWLWKPELSEVPLFPSNRWLRQVKNPKPALMDWALDSGGFTEISTFGRWETSAASYIESVRRYMADIGRLDWIAPQDWMCEPPMLVKTGLTIEEHQRRTIDSFLELTTLAPEVPVIPVLQGWELGDYVRCREMYAEAGVDLSGRTVGLGSVCRRQSTDQIGLIVTELSDLALHGFGVKTLGVQKYGHLLSSSDSLSWSARARRAAPLPGCSHGKLGIGNCANCPKFALQWRDKVLRGLAA